VISPRGSPQGAQPAKPGKQAPPRGAHADSTQTNKVYGFQKNALPYLTLMLQLTSKFCYQAGTARQQKPMGISATCTFVGSSATTWLSSRGRKQIDRSTMKLGSLLAGLLIFLSVVTEGGCQDLSAEVAGLQQEVQELKQLLSQLLGAEVIGNGKAACTPTLTSSWLSRKCTCLACMPSLLHATRRCLKRACEPLSASNTDMMHNCPVSY